MNQSRSLGIVLLVIGILLFSYAGVVTYRTRDKVVDAGPIQVTADKTHKVYFPPIVGAVCVVGGIVLMIASEKRA
jgi:hypothetical protein